jgi:hypothetical protein
MLRLPKRYQRGSGNKIRKRRQFRVQNFGKGGNNPLKVKRCPPNTKILLAW